MNCIEILRRKIQIGISKFCETRPKNCITVGTRGTHSVCVCKIHQNVKLIIAALPFSEKVTYHDLFEQLVCSMNARLCMLHRCGDCPGITSLQTFLETKLDQNLFENDDPIVLNNGFLLIGQC